MSAEHDTRFDDAGPAYLLGALEPDEAVAFERHLADCGDCRRQVDYLKLAADALPASVPQLTAPAALKDRIMATVNAEAQLLHAASPQADLVPKARERRRFALPSWLGRPGFALAATLLVVVAVGVAAIGGGSDNRDYVAQVAPAGAKVNLTVRGDERHSTLTASGLGDPGDGRVYQVWLKRGNDAPRPTNALFSPDNSGTASVDVPGSMDDVDDVLVTSEPDGGSQSPTRPPVITVKTA